MTDGIVVLLLRLLLLLDFADDAPAFDLRFEPEHGRLVVEREYILGFDGASKRGEIELNKKIVNFLSFIVHNMILRRKIKLEETSTWWNAESRLENRFSFDNQFKILKISTKKETKVDLLILINKLKRKRRRIGN